MLLIAGKRLVKELIPIHHDEESGFILKDRVFHSLELVRLAINALEDKVHLCRKSFELKTKESIIKNEFTLLQSKMKEVR